jgi:hypothetical protein
MVQRRATTSGHALAGHWNGPYDHADITTLGTATLVFDLLRLMVNRSKGATIRGEEALEVAGV